MGRDAEPRPTSPTRDRLLVQHARSTDAHNLRPDRVVRGAASRRAVRLAPAAATIPRAARQDAAGGTTRSVVRRTGGGRALLSAAAPGRVPNPLGPRPVARVSDRDARHRRLRGVVYGAALPGRGGAPP